MTDTTTTSVILTPDQVALRELISSTLEEHQRITVPGGCTCGGIYVNHTEHLVAMVAQAVERAS